MVFVWGLLACGEYTNAQIKSQMDYLSAIREAKDRGASHDYLRQVFIEFARKSFRVDPVDVELEKGIKGAKLRGSIDALYQDIVFEFKRDLKLEREKGKEGARGAYERP